METGPAQVIGEALNASKTSARPFVTVMSHSIWNDQHGVMDGAREGLPSPRHAFSDFARMGAKTVHIKDQNPRLSRPYSEYSWMQNATVAELQWLWDRGQLAGKSAYDCSGAGLTYYALTGDDSATPAKLRAFIVK